MSVEELVEILECIDREQNFRHVELMEVDEFLDLGFGGWVVVLEALLEGKAAEQLPNCMGVSYCYRDLGLGT